MMTPFLRNSSVVKSLLCGSIVLVLGSKAFGAAGVQASIPDFYQHQFWNKLPGDPGPGNPTGPIAGWESNGGWCYQTAVIDALYPWQIQPAYKNLTLKAMNNVAANVNNISTAGKWLPAMAAWIQDVNSVDAPILPTVSSYIAYTGVAGLVSNNFYVDPANGTVYQPDPGGPVTLAGAGPGGAGLKASVVQQAGANVTATQWYETQVDKGRSSVIMLQQTAASATNGLWWGNYHAVAGAGYKDANTIYVADPDSNNGNTAANAGWYNLTPPPRPKWDTSAAGIAAAVTTVQNNQFTAAEATASPPVMGNAKGGGNNYALSDVYGTWTMDAKGYNIQSSDAGGPNAAGRYAGTQIGCTFYSRGVALPTYSFPQMQFISPVVAAAGPASPKAAGPDTTYNVSVDLSGDIDSTIDQIEIFPLDPLADTNFTFNDPGWQESDAVVDPWNGPRLGGGESLTVGTGSDITSADDDLVATMDTNGDNTEFDVFMHDSQTGDWFLNTVGYSDQETVPEPQLIPEPATLSVLAMGCCGLLLRRKRLQEPVQRTN